MTIITQNTRNKSECFSERPVFVLVIVLVLVFVFVHWDLGLGLGPGPNTLTGTRYTGRGGWGSGDPIFFFMNQLGLLN